MKKNKRQLYTTGSSSVEYSRIVKITVGVALFLILTYFIAGLLTGEINLKKKKKVEQETYIQYEEIISGEILNRNDNDYYVMTLNFTDNLASYYLSFIDNYTSQENSLPFYIVDLDKKVNNNILKGDDEYIQSPTKVEDIRVLSPTILKVSNHKVVSYIIGQEKVMEFFD